MRKTPTKNQTIEKAQSCSFFFLVPCKTFLCVTLEDTSKMSLFTVVKNEVINTFLTLEGKVIIGIVL